MTTPTNFDPSASSSNMGNDRVIRGQMLINVAKESTMYDVLESAKLNFKPIRVQTQYNDPVTGKTRNGSHFAIIRDDSGDQVGNVGERYNPIGYTEALESIYGEVLSLGGVPTRAISFDNGSKGAIQFLLPDTWKVGDFDHKVFTTVYNSLDGSMPVMTGYTDVRIVCGNTFALGQKDMSQKARHTANIGLKLSKFADILGVIKQGMDSQVETLNKLNAMVVSQAQVNEFIDSLFPVTSKNEDGTANKTSANKRGELQAAINAESFEQVTGYTLFNGVTRLVDHSWATKRDRSADEQWEYVSGTGQAIKDKAYNQLKLIALVV